MKDLHNQCEVIRMSEFQEKLKDVLGISNTFSEAKYVGRTAYIQLDKEIKIKAELVALSAADSFDGIRLTVINNTCVVDNVIIRFDDYFSPNQLLKENIIPHIWVRKGTAEWYSYPDYDDHKSLTNAIDDYVVLFSGKNLSKRKGYLS